MKIWKNISDSGFRSENLTDKANKLLEENQLIISDRRVNHAIFSRLKREPADTAHKRNALRSLAFWRGHEKEDFPLWNYENLLKICPKTKMAVHEDGVRVAVSVKGEMITEKMLKWLRKEINAIQDEGNRAKFHDMLTVYTDFPKTDEDSMSERPASFIRCISDAVSLAHQLSVRWTLSLYSRRTDIRMVIAAGKLSMLELSSLKPLLDARVIGNHGIWLTDFAHLCARMSDVKVGFDTPTELEPRATIWPVKYFWTFIYYDFIPALLKPGMLPTKTSELEEFRQELHFPGSEKEMRFKAISAIHSSPRNTLLILEVAKVCFFRRMFHEANAVLSRLLMPDPYNVVARTLRMLIYLNLSLEHQDFSMFDLISGRAVSEGLLIQKHCTVEDEEVLTNIGVVYYSVAVKLLFFLRKKREAVSDRDKYKDKVIRLLKDGEICFEEGMSLSPTGGTRSFFWFTYTRSLRKLLERDEELFEGASLTDSLGVYEQTGRGMSYYLGWLERPARKDVRQLSDEAVDRLAGCMIQTVKMYESLITFSSYAPNIKCSCAAYVFDFSPVLTSGLFRHIRKWLEDAEKMADRLRKEKVGVWSVAGAFTRIQSPDEFVQSVRRIRKRIFNKNTEKYLAAETDSFRIPREAFSGLKFMHLTIDEEPEPDSVPILEDDGADDLKLVISPRNQFRG